MKSKSKRAAFLGVESLKVELTEILRSKAFNPAYPKYSMKEIEKRLEAFLGKVDKLAKEYDLDDTVPLEFKKEAIEKTYEVAIKRGDYEWAASFAKKYGF